MRISLTASLITYVILNIFAPVALAANSRCDDEMTGLQKDMGFGLAHGWMLRPNSEALCVNRQPDKMGESGVQGATCVNDFADAVHSFLFISQLDSTISITPCPGDKCGPDAAGHKCCESSTPQSQFGWRKIVPS